MENERKQFFSNVSSILGSEESRSMTLEDADVLKRFIRVYNIEKIQGVDYPGFQDVANTSATTTTASSTTIATTLSNNTS